MNKKINLTKIFAFACLILSSFFLQAQNQGVRFNLNTAINNRINSGDTNITASELSLPSNRLRVSPDDAGGFTHILIKDRSNITIDLTGIEIICMETMRAITIENCTNFTIKGLSVDYDPLPFTQATITSMSGDKKTINFSFINGYSTDVLQNDSRAKVQVFNTAGNLVSPEYYDVTYNINTANRTGSMTKTVTGGDEKNGDILVLSARNGRWGDHTVFANNCNNLKFENITLYSGPVFGFYETYGVGSQYINCKVMRRPNNTTEVRSRGVMRMRSVEADAFHSKYGNNPTYSGCEASHMADDGIAINGDFHVVVQSVSNSNTFKIIGKGGTTPNLMNGEPIEIVSNTGGRVLPDATIQSIVNTGNLSTTESNWLNSQGFIGDADVAYNTSMKVYTITLAAGRRVTLAQGSVINNANRIGNGFSISGCKIGPNRSRGILVKASHGIIQNNQLTENWGPAIKLAPEYQWLEAGSSVDVDILSNTISKCHDAPIAVFAYGANNQIAPAGAHDDIKIQGNTISGSTNPGIAVTSTTNLCIANNTISSPDNSLIRDFIANEFGRNTDPNRTIYTLNSVDVACNNSGVINVRSISVNPVSDFLAFNETLTITKSINPSNATNQNVTWSIVGNSNVGSITVDANGNAVFKASSNTAGVVNVCATSAENNTLVECATIEVGQQVDAISNIDGPSIVVPGATSTVTINYSATAERQIFIILQNKSTNAWVHEYIKTIPAGTGTETVNFSIDPTLTNGIDTHQWVAFITTSPNGGYNERLDTKFIFDVDVDNTAVRVNVNPTSLFLSFNEQYQLQSTVLNTTNQTVTWSSNNTAVATVNSNTGLVTAKSTTGTAIITATSSADSSQKATCTITVGIPVDEIRSLNAPQIIAPGQTASVTVNYSATVERRIFTVLQDNTNFVAVKQDIRIVPAGTGSYTIDFDIAPTIPVGQDAYEWVCYITTAPNGGFNERLEPGQAVYNVDVDNSGVIVIVNPASAVITVSEQLPLSAQVFAATNTSVTWSIQGGSSNIATVNPSTGVVTGVGSGTVKVIATSNEDPSVTSISNITVGNIVDGISKVDGPNTVSQGNAVSVSVNYSSTKTQEIVVFLQTTDTYLLASNWVVTTVSPGVSTINASVTPNSSLSNGTAYRWVAQILGTTPLIDGFDAPVTVDSNFSLLDFEIKAKLLVYPNPTKDILNIILDEGQNKLNASIVDLSGRTVLTKQLNSNKNTLDLSSLSNGVYMLYTKKGNNVTSVNKIIVSH